MVRDLNNKNMNPVTGKVSCAFNPNLGEKPLCPLAETVTIAQKFLDNDVWLVRDDEESTLALPSKSSRSFVSFACDVSGSI